MEKNNFSPEERYACAARVTLVGTVANVVISLLKLFAGIVANSRAMVADAVHSFSDLSSDIVVLFSLRAAKKPVDATHHYGHGKIETLAAVVMGVLLTAVAIGILFSAGELFWAYFHGNILAAPGWLAFYAAIFSVVTKEILYQYSIRTANKINSDLMRANAWHHRSDALSSFAAMLGILGAILLPAQWRLLDPIAAVVVAFFVLRVAWKILKKGVAELLEASLAPEMEEKIIALIQKVDGVKDFHHLRTRSIGINISVDVHIKVIATLDIVQAHNIATAVEKTVRDEFGSDSFVNVHVEPCHSM